MREPLPGCPEKRWIGRSFGRAAAGYDGLAALQRQVADDLLAEFAGGEAVPANILDIGAGTGYCGERLAGRFPGSELIVLDLAEAMVNRARQRPGLANRGFFLCADAEALPLRSAMVDLAVSNLAFQWCSNLAVALAEMRRVVVPGGRVALSLFVGDTLCELKHAWAEVDDHSHVNPFVGAAELGALASAAGLSGVRLRQERLTLAYDSVEHLMRELKGWGAGNVTAHRPRHLTGKARLAAMIRAYPPAMAGGRITATFEVASVSACAG